MPNLTAVEAEAIAEHDFFADLADQVRAHGPAAITAAGIDLDEPVEDFIASLLADYPATSAIAA